MNTDKRAGVTMVELLLSTTILAITLTITATFIFSVRHKAILQRDSDQVISMLEFARQQSISAYRGYAYSVEFSGENYVSISPGTTNRTLSSTIQVEVTPASNKVEFAKRTGIPDEEYQITLSMDRLTSIITISKSGSITQEPIRKI